MSRARATALVLVNWRGVFYERYLLDRHVTALEGANGAGKTTVMIAAYVVLLPDLTRLKFTNLGETGATGGDKGIYGRLGEPGPSYAAMEIELDAGRRVYAGVYLERKAAPALSLTPFIISGLPDDAGAHRIFLRESEAHEHVATMEDIEASATQLGAKLEVFGSAKDYFSSLFERGVSPLRLSLDEERNKFNDMLRTSMTGGISRTLTSDLRSFLFKQQTGLFDTLTRMRKNLEACRRTRLEVGEARVLEHEINGVYTAGHAMFEAALEASQKQAAEHRLAAERAAERLAIEHDQHAELTTRVREAESLEESLSPRLERARKADAEARARVTRIGRAAAAAERLGQIEEERRRIAPLVSAASAAQVDASAAREQARAQRDTAQQTLHRSASGLASLQAGLEELHRQAHAHRQARERLGAARDALGAVVLHAATLGLPEGEASAWLADFGRTLNAALPESTPSESTPSESTPSTAPNDVLSPDLLADATRRLKVAIGELDRTRAERDRQAAVSERRRRDHAEARAALASLCGEPVEVELGARAREQLGRLNQLELLGTRQDELAQEWQRLRALAERQRAVRAEVEALGLGNKPSARDFMQRLGELDAALLATGEQQRASEAALRELDERDRSWRAERKTLASRLETFEKLAPVAQRITETGLALPGTRADLNAALRAAHDAERALTARARELQAERQAALRLAQHHEAMGGGIPAELSRLSELVDGQMLATRYEELELDDARRVQAELGPLVNAIVVDDLESALPILLEQADAPADIWLLRAGARWPEAGGEASLAANGSAREPTTHAAVVDLGHGVRISRWPVEVSLGRAARQRQAERARGDAEAAERATAELHERQELQAALLRDLERLLEHWETWALGDPGPELALQTELGASATAERETLAVAARERRVESARLGAQREALRAWLDAHHLLDPPDYAHAAERAEALLEQAKSAARELSRAEAARRTLIGVVHDLSDTPPDDAALETWQRERAALEAQRDRLFGVSEALAVVGRERAALGWSEAERALGERTELVPELEAQHQRALGEVSAAQLAFERAEASWERTTHENQNTAAQLAALEAHHGRALAELGSEARDELSVDALAAAEEELSRQAAALDKLQRDARSIDAELALARERLGEADKRRRSAELAVEQERRERQPSEEAWHALAAAAREANVLTLDATLTHEALPSSSAQRWLEAEGKRELLCDRLAAARGGAELAEKLRPHDSSNSIPLGPMYLAAWLEVRAWLLRRLPAQIAELGQPLLGLSRLRADLSELESRLGHQEGDLRGTSADVARSIDVQLRRATAQVKRLNRALDGVRFGSIHGMKVQLARIEKMDQVLKALREGETQELLFQSNLPIEEALDEIFRRHAGGRTGGHKLVDYREYIELAVHIQRRTSETWERVNPSQVSTGEAIGIGAALMMVILAEWEREDQLLRQKRAFGSLRFLFLDEANRLSQDNLGVLFDLCEVLDLQLLIAAPEVARAEGNTTYRLVRRVSEDGLEEVLVTGRRATLPGSVDSGVEPVAPEDLEAPGVAAPEPAPEAPPRVVAEQLGLL